MRFDVIFQGRSREAREWGDLVRAASPHQGPWPKVSVWHGAADATVKPVNADEIVKQWTDVHGLAPAPAFEDMVDGYPRRVWRGADGRNLIESYSITGMAHGAPIAPGGRRRMRQRRRRSFTMSASRRRTTSPASGD